MEIPPLEVQLSRTDMDYIRAAAEFTPTYSAWETFLFSGTALETIPVPFLPADLQRRRAYFKVATPGTAQPVTAQGSVTSPGASAVIATIPAVSITPGQYLINWTVGLGGTPGAGDTDNFRLRIGATGVDTSANPGITGQWTQAPYGPVFLNGANSVSVIAVAAGTAGAVYDANITLQPVAPAASGFVLIGELGKVSNGQGGRIYAGQSWETHSHAAIWIAGDGITPGLAVTLEVERDQE
jgi:hypothetical protein